MKLYSSLLANSNSLKNKTAICIGNFDGMHLGPLALFGKLAQKVGDSDLEKGILSFAPHPKRVIDRRSLRDQQHEQSFFQLTSVRKKIQLASALDFDFFYLAHFTKKFSQLSAEDFIEEFLLKKLNPKIVVIGYDWAFGRNREGSIKVLEERLAKHKVELVVVEAVESENRKVSSSLLKEKLKVGDLAAYKKYSSRNFALLDRVKRGDSRGKGLGFPTANIIPKMQLLPPDGVYATLAKIDGESYRAVSNVGLRPTFCGKQRIVETHIIGKTDLELYGKYLGLSFLHFIREEKRFENSEQLVSQISQDIECAKRILLVSSERLLSSSSRDAKFCVSTEEDDQPVELRLSLDAKYSGMRLDLALIEAFKSLELKEEHSFLSSSSRNKLSYWIQEGYILLNSARTKSSQRLKDLSEISISIPQPKPNWLTPDKSITLQVVFEDADILVVDKPAGLVVHPGAGHEEGTLAHALLAHIGESIQQVAHPLRPGIVHRLDKDTSGLMVIAKTEFAYHSLIQQFKPSRSIKRAYFAISHALPKTSETVISLPIARDQNNKTKMSVDKERDKEAITHWRIEKNLKYGVQLDLNLETGRTHQIRVHLQAVGAEIIGDPVYGRALSNQSKSIQDACKKIKRQALHAYSLEFIHPRTKEIVSFRSDLPEDIKELIKCLS